MVLVLCSYVISLVLVSVLYGCIVVCMVSVLQSHGGYSTLLWLYYDCIPWYYSCIMVLVRFDYGFIIVLVWCYDVCIMVLLWL